MLPQKKKDFRITYTDYDPVVPLEKTVANLNIDMIGRTDPKRKVENQLYLSYW